MTWSKAFRPGAAAIFSHDSAQPLVHFERELTGIIAATDDEYVTVLQRRKARPKQAATELAQSMGFETIDAGGPKNARHLEPLAGLNIYLGYGTGLGTAIAPTWIRRVRQGCEDRLGGRDA